MFRGSRYRRARLRGLFPSALLEALLSGKRKRCERQRNAALRRNDWAECLEDRTLLSSAPVFGEISFDDLGDGAVIQRWTLDADGTPSVATASSDAQSGAPAAPANLNGNGLQFNLIPAAGMSQTAIDGFQEAANLWSSILTDDIIVNIEIDFTTLGAGILGSAGSTTESMSVPVFRTSLTADATSAADITAAAVIGTTISRFRISTGGGLSATGPAADGEVEDYEVTIGAAGAPELSISPADANKVEGNSGDTAFTFTVTRSGSTIGPESVDFAVTGAGSAAADAADFGGAYPAGTVNFADGEATQLISVNVSGDSLHEFDQGFTVTLSNPGGPAVITTSSADGTILNDDQSLVSVTVSSVSLSEDSAGVFTFQFERVNADIESPAVAVQYSIAGTATAGVDHDGVASGTVTFAAGQTLTTLAVDPTADAIVELDESVIVFVSTAHEYDVSSGNASAVGTISDDDHAAVTIQDVSVVEGVGLLFTVFLDNSVQDTFDVRVTFTDGTDYDNTPVLLSFSGNAGETHQFTVATTNDSISEGTEDFTVNLEASASGPLQAGDPDVRFGDNGHIAAPFYSNISSDEQATAVAVAPSGKAYLIGDNNEIVAYNDDGSLDLSFGQSGRASLRLNANDVLAQPDGRIVVVGWRNVQGHGADFAISRTTLQSITAATSWSPELVALNTP